MKKTKKLSLHNSWEKKAKERYKGYWSDDRRKSYVFGAEAYRDRLLEALKHYRIMTNAEIFQHNGELIVKLDEVVKDFEVLVKGLIAETKIKENADSE